MLTLRIVGPKRHTDVFAVSMIHMFAKVLIRRKDFLENVMVEVWKIGDVFVNLLEKSNQIKI